ncbi:hypothetical protein AB0B88_15935 [Micromonospora haikouensis]|uniref:hypothetical protein n=1 Tax=Micromonospora haikouensis TaxID=686309 RepID=UPI0033DB49C4
MPSNPPASDHNPPGRVLIGPPGADPADGGFVDVGHTSRDGISDTLERLALHLNRARTAFIVAMRPAVARALGFLAAVRPVIAYRERIERGRARADRRRSATRRAMAARRPRPARRPAHLHHTRTAYRHRQ